MIYVTLIIIHWIALVSWFAGLFYLPRLFVYHTRMYELHSYDTFCLMERRLYLFIMYPAMMTVIGSGTGLIMYYGWEWFINSYWLHAKLAAVSALLVYHFWLGWIITQFRSHKQPYSETFFRVINEVPTVLLILIICLVKIKSLY